MKTKWLLSYNTATLLAWAVFLAHVLTVKFRIDNTGVMLLAIAQGLAVFEIINAMAGIAGANWFLTMMQVLSRLLMVALLTVMPFDSILELGFVSGYAVIAVAWGITEIVRALYYSAGLLNLAIRPITWMRYTFFMGLYPLGVAGEFMIMFSFWEWRGFDFDLINGALAIVALSYSVFFPMLFRHMLTQRKKKLA